MSGVLGNTATRYLADPAYQHGPISTTMRGREIGKVIDLTTDRNTYIPMNPQFYPIPQINNQMNVQQSSVTVSINQCSGSKISYVLVSFVLPAQYAGTMSDAIAYDSFPGLAAIASVEVYISDYAQTERLVPATIRDRIITHYGIEWFNSRGTDMLGGSRQNGSENQQMRTYKKYSNHYNLADKNQNLLMPALQIDIPIPIHLLMNPEMYIFDLCSNMSIDLKVAFNPASSLFDRTNTEMLLTPLSGELNLWAEGLSPVEEQFTFNLLPYAIGNKSAQDDYYFKDQTVESWVTKQTFNTLTAISLKPRLTKEIRAFAYPSVWTAGRTFFGSRCDDATANFCAAHIQNSFMESSKDFTVCLSSGMFMGEKLSYASIFIHDHSATSITLRYARANVIDNQDLIITTTIPWNDLGLLYLNLNACLSSSPPIETFGPCLFALRTFNLNFVEYDPQDPYHGDVDPRVQIGTTIKLVNGYYVIDGRSYNSATIPALVVDANKRFALLNITNVEVNTNVLSFQSWKLCISEPIVEPNYFNSFVVKKFVILNRRDNVYLTLDDETRLEVESVTYDDTQTKTINKKELQFGYSLNELAHPWSPTIFFDYSYKRYENGVKIDTNCWRDLRPTNIQSLKITPKFVDIPLIVYGTEKTTYQKYHRGDEYELLCTQSVYKIMKYSDHSMSVVGVDENRAINNLIYEQYLVPNKFSVGPVAMQRGLTFDESGQMSTTKNNPNLWNNTYPNNVESLSGAHWTQQSRGADSNRFRATNDAQTPYFSDALSSAPRMKFGGVNKFANHRVVRH